MIWRTPLFRVHTPPWSELGPALERVFASGYLAEGEEVASFEQQLKTRCGTENLFTMSSCTNALLIALKLAGVGPGSVVLTTPMTCVATVAPIALLGASIVWLDVDPLTGMVNPDTIRETYKKPDAAVVVDWGGDVAAIPELRAVFDEMYGGLPLIEDAAQAFGTQVDGADYRCFSLQAIKLLTTGDGGFMVTRKADDAERGKRMSWFGIDRANFRLPSGEINWDLDIPEIGIKGNMNNVTAAIGNCQLPYMDRVTALHQSNAFAYTRLLSDMKEVQVPPRPHGSAYWVFTITCDDRDGLEKHLQDQGIQASKMHTRLDRYSGIPVVGDTRLPGLEAFSSRHLCLPCGWLVSEADVQTVVDAVKAFYAGRE